MEESAGDIVPTGAFRSNLLRLGVAIWVFSWIPLPVIFGIHTPWREVFWVGQFVIGIIGLAIAGKELADMVRAAGWKQTPGLMLSALVHGRVPAQALPLPNVEPDATSSKDD